ncbi:hypothetical protein [Streptomyces sp. NPDC002490]|uniref:hypothetical protein n=1 Tax=Streptomyces sp. NPDC002490 TaxID=3154416 RepID=UPI00331A0D8C
MKQHPDPAERPAEAGPGPTEEKDRGAADPGPGAGERPPTPPADEEPAPEAWEAVEQLFALAPHLRSGRANVMGDTRVSGDVVAGDKRVDLHLHEGAPPRLHAVGPLPPAELDHVAETFVPGPRHRELCALLTAGRVLVLRGRTGTGRRTAALALLLEVGDRDGDTIALDPGTEPADFAEQVRPGGTHVVVDPVTSRDGPLRDVHLNAVRQRLGEDGLFVVVTTHGTATQEVTAHDWEPPAARDIARAHLRHALRLPTAADGDAELHRLLELASSTRYLGSGPAPSDTVGFARLLARHAEGHCGTEELDRYGDALAAEVTGGWFDESTGSSGVSLRDKAFLISLAVFDGMPYPLVAELGDRLHLLLHAVEDPERSAGQAVFGSSLAERLVLARAVEYEDEVDTPWGRMPERAVAFRNASAWRAVLGHVWHGHPAVRRPLLAWLETLVADHRIAVRLRAAVATGVLAATDFGYAFGHYLDPWGAAPGAARRQLAAWALYTAAEHGADTAVRRLLSLWSRRHDPARRWTAARTYALLGSATATSALRDVELMASTGPEPEPVLRAALEQALEALLQGPAAVTVLERLVQWLEPRGPLFDLAAAGFLRSARRRHWAEDAGATAWPRLLWLAHRDDRARRCVVALWRALLGDRATRDPARDELARWVRAAERASARPPWRTAPEDTGPTPGWEPEPAPEERVSDVEAALADLLPLLVKTENDRARLDYLLRRHPDLADAAGPTTTRLRAALAD